MSARPPVVVSGIAEHYADFFAHLVDEDEAGVGAGDGGGEFAHGLRHQARVQAHEAIAHFAFELGLGNQCGDGIDHNHVDDIRRDQGVGDFEGLFAVIRLRDQQVVDVDAECARIGGIERMFGVNERGRPAGRLRLRDHL